MEFRMGSKLGTVLTGVKPVLAEIQESLQAQPPEWLKALRENPAGLANLEQEIHITFTKMADQLVAGLLAEATASSEFAEAAKKK